MKMKAKNFTFTHASAEADRYIAEQMDLIVPEIVRSVPGLRSVILMGGYGRGEGAVATTASGFRLVNDFDFYVICDKYVEDSDLEAVALRCSEIIGKGGVAHPEGFEERYDFERFFHIDIRCLVLDKLSKLPPTIRYYEMKQASALLYGEDLRHLFPEIKADAIPKSEGIRLLMNRMLLLIMAMRPGFLNENEIMSDDERNIMAYYIGKSYLSCAEALLLFSGKYLPTYSGRAEYFKQHFALIAPQLASSLPHLPEKVTFFTNYKSNPDIGDRDVAAMWFQCRSDIIKVYIYCLEQLTGRELSGSAVSEAKILKKYLAPIYFAPYADYYAERLVVPKKLTLAAINRLGRLYLAYKYCRALKKETGRAWWRPLFGLEPGIIILYLAPIVLQGIDRVGNEDKASLSWVWDELKAIFPFSAEPEASLSWSKVKTIWLKAYRTYYLQRFV